uniref:Uncharacterized protein n=1 Tax=Arundo donax TaxID=35708 RepID=A0A0A8YMV2_ARUDO
MVANESEINILSFYRMARENKCRFRVVTRKLR